MKPSVIAFAGLMLLPIAACRPAPEFIEGGFYSVTAERGYAIIKILKVDEGGVHLRIYSNVFPERPRDLDTAKLYMAGVDHKPTEQLGMGHAPISHPAFRSWDAEFIKREPVREEELEGYEMWKEASGGYF